MEASRPVGDSASPAAAPRGVLAPVPPGWEIVALAGRGTATEVWQVRQSTTGQTAALKVLRPEFQDHPTARQLLANEAEVLAAVSSPRIIRLRPESPAASSGSLLLEWLSGVTLEQRLVERGALPWVEAVWIARQAAQGLAELWDAGFLHGDLKPANVWLHADGQVTLLDLGFARPRPRSGATAVLNDPPLLTGTPEYLAPEVLAPGAATDERRDLYSLGVMLFRMLAGELPFTAPTHPDLLRQQQSALPPRLRALAPDTPRELCDLVGRLLAKQPLRRGSSWREITSQLVHLELLGLTLSAALADAC